MALNALIIRSPPIVSSMIDSQIKALITTGDFEKAIKQTNTALKQDLNQINREFERGDITNDEKILRSAKAYQDFSDKISSVQVAMKDAGKMPTHGNPLLDLLFAIPDFIEQTPKIIDAAKATKALNDIQEGLGDSVQEALDLGLIAQVVSTDDLENTCLEKLRHLSPIPDYALVESRRMLQPDIEEIRKYIEAGFEGALRCLYKMKT